MEKEKKNRTYLRRPMIYAHDSHTLAIVLVFENLCSLLDAFGLVVVEKTKKKYIFM